MTVKIAVPSKGDTLQAEVDARMARAENFIIIDLETGDFRVLKNSEQQAHGMGPKVVQNLAAEGVNVLIARSIGMNAANSLQSAGIEAYLCDEETVESAIEKFKQGKLPRA